MITPIDAGIAVYFSDFFGVDPATLVEYGAFNVSLVADMPLFVDPFLLFNSDNPEYQDLHKQVIRYLQFLLDRSRSGIVDSDMLAAYFVFKEVRENWLGFSRFGNRGSGLGMNFASRLNENLASVFSDFGNETITKGSHLEKLCLVGSGVGADSISDFTVCLIKEYLLKYTEAFAIKHLSPNCIKTHSVPRVRFNYDTASWMPASFQLPTHEGRFVILSPEDILTRGDTWISHSDFMQRFDHLALTLPNDTLRGQLNHFMRTQLVIPDRATKKERDEAHHKVVIEAIRAFPSIIEYYIKDREDAGEEAEATSSDRVDEVYNWFVDHVGTYIGQVLGKSKFYDMKFDTYEAALHRLEFLKHFIEHQGGYRIFYNEGSPVQRESDLQLLYKLTWFGTPFDLNAEVNNGRGPVDFKVSSGSKDKSIIEFKLAKSTKLKQGLQKQLAVYEEVEQTHKSIWGIFYFDSSQLDRVEGILREIGYNDRSNLVLIDCRSDNKPSGSTA